MLRNHFSFLRGEIGLASVRADAGVHVKAHERCPKSGAAPVYGEVFILLEGLEICKFRAQHPVGFRLAGPELGKLGGQVRNDDLDDLVQVGQAVALSVLEPVVRVSLHDHAFAGIVALDGKGAGSDDIRRVRVYVPHRGKGAVIHALLQYVLGIYGCAHIAEEGSEGPWEDALDGVVVQGSNGHWRFHPLAAILV